MTWVACQIADICMVKQRIASMLQLPHVAYCSHKQRLEIRPVCERYTVLAEKIRSIGKTMTASKCRLKNRAIIRNVTSLAPLLPNDTG